MPADSIFATVAEQKDSTTVSKEIVDIVEEFLVKQVSVEQLCNLFSFWIETINSKRENVRFDGI